jgi:hypothetical protein
VIPVFSFFHVSVFPSPDSAEDSSLRLSASDFGVSLPLAARAARRFTWRLRDREGFGRAARSAASSISDRPLGVGRPGNCKQHTRPARQVIQVGSVLSGRFPTLHRGGSAALKFAPDWRETDTGFLSAAVSGQRNRRNYNSPSRRKVARPIFS